MAVALVICWCFFEFRIVLKGMEYFASNLLKRKMSQATIFNSLFSPTSPHVIAPTDSGHIITYDYTSTASPRLYTCSEQSLYSSCIIQDKMFCGSDGCILSWETDSLLREYCSPIVMSMNCGEVNSLCAGQNDTLIAGCGNGMVFSVDVAAGTIISQRSGHTGFVHQVSAHQNIVTSCDDSGVVLIHDDRVQDAVKKLDMSAKLKNKCWCSSVQINSNGTLLYLGGGTGTSGYVAIAHVGSIGNSDGIVKLADTSAPIQSMLVMDDEVLTGGPQSQLHYRSAISLDLISTTKVSASSVFSISKHPSEDIVAVAGTVPMIDLFIIKGHRARVINPLDSVKCY